MKKWKIILIALLLSVTITSCSKEREYEFIIENDTDYVLEIVRFSCAVNKHSQKVDSNSSTGPFIIEYKAPFLPLSEPLLCLTILRYSDSKNSYENTNGRTFSISGLSRRRINYLKVGINPSPHNSTNIFDMKIQN